MQPETYKINQAKYTLAVRAKNPGLNSPWLEGIKINGEYHIIYSPYDLAAGWQGDDHPLNLGYQPGDAMQIGANILI